MAKRLILTYAVAVVVLGTSVAAQAASAHQAKIVRTLLTTKAPIRAFAQNSGRIAWIGAKWHVGTRAFGGKRRTLDLGTAWPFVAPANKGVPPRLALSGARVLWTRAGGGNEFEMSAWARKAGARRGPRMIALTDADREERTGSYFGAVAAAGSTLAYSTVDYQCVDPNDCTQLAVHSDPRLTGTYLVTGTSGSAPVPGLPGAIELAVSGHRMAILPAPEQIAATQISDVSSPSLAQPGTTVQIRDTTTGSLVAQFTPPGTVRALALSGSVAAVVDQLGNGTREIESYDPTTGALLGVAVGLAPGDALSVSGNTLVYAVGNKIEAMDATTGVQRVLAVSPGKPIGPSVAGKRVAWAVNAHGHGRILALTLP